MARVFVPKRGFVPLPCDCETAEEAIKFLKNTLQSDAWHGNTLLSCGPHKLDPQQKLSEFNGELVLANFSPLSTTPPIRIPKTELRGITIEQLAALVDFVKDIASKWCEAHEESPNYGNFLDFETFNLYHATFWVIKPATLDHGREGCSYVELVAISMDDQRPKWFVSHAWLEPIVRFMRCLKQHALVRQLSPQCAYWVCAYANNQHDLKAEIQKNPRKTSFYRAIKMCAGVLLILDSDATPFTRIWCCFEESIAVEERNAGNALLLDLAATDDDGTTAHVITDGLAEREQQLIPFLGFFAKSQREAKFPKHILVKGLDVDIVTANASKESDKRQILNSIALPRAATKQLEMEADLSHQRYDAVNRALAAHFGLAGWFSSVVNALDTSRLYDALAADEQRRVVQLSFTGCMNFSDTQLDLLLQHLPPQLQVLRLDLAFTSIESLNFPETSPELLELSLRIANAPAFRNPRNLLNVITPKMRSLHLWFSNLPELHELRLSQTVIIAAADGLKDLVLQVHGCPLTAETITHLKSFIQQIRDKELSIETWIDIEGINLKNSTLQCFQCFRCSRFSTPQRSLAEFEPQSIGNPSIGSHSLQPWESEASSVVTNDSSDMPFPCSHNGCFRFHSNGHGFCQEHRWSRFTKKNVSGFKMSWSWLQLLMLVLAQASVEIQDRWLLKSVLVSLLPTAILFLFLQKDVGGFSTCFYIPLFVGVVASWIQTGKRFDKMQRAMLELLLTTETKYLGNLHVTGEGAHEGFLFDEDVAESDLQQSVTDLWGNFGEAKRLRLVFQSAVCGPLSQIVNRQVEAKVKLLTDCDISDFSVDVLYCKVFCTGLQQIQEAWHMLKGLADTRDIHIKSLQDDFARVSASKKCCRVVLSLEGYFATVWLVDETLDRLEQELDSMHHFANSLGLLDEAKPQHWASTFEAIATPIWCRVSTWLLRCAALLLSATLVFAFFISSFTRYRYNGYWYKGLVCACPFFVLFFVFAYDLLVYCMTREESQMRRRRLKPTQLLYRKHFGVQGGLYHLKVAILQLLTVLLQAKGKFSMLSVLVDGVKTDLWSLHSFLCFIVLLGFNIIYPAFILAFPRFAVSRVGAACMDAALDLSYVVVWLVLLAQTERAASFYAERNPLVLLSKLASHDFWSYMSVYFSVAHVCCVCRSLEQIDWPQLLQFRPRKRSVGQRLTWWMIALAYALGLSLTVWALLQQVHPDPCAPCRCASIVSQTYRLESCSAAAFFNLPELKLGGRAGRTISDISPDALRGLTKLQHLDLSNNGLKELPQGIFRSLECLSYLDLRFNQLTALPVAFLQGVGSAYYKGECGDDEGRNDRKVRIEVDGLDTSYLRPGGERRRRYWHPHSLHLKHMDLTELPAGVFDGLEDLQELHLQGNRLRTLPEGLFRNLRDLSELHLHGNCLRTLPEGLFRNLSSLRELYLQNNGLEELPSRPFADLKNLRYLDLRNQSFNSLPVGMFAGLGNSTWVTLYIDGISPSNLGSLSFSELHLEDMNLTELHAGVFDGLEHLWKLSLKGNRLRTLPEGLFRNLSSLSILDLQNNRLRTLPEGVFQSLSGLWMLDLSNNGLEVVEKGSFQGLAKLIEMDLSDNSLSILPEGIFRDVGTDCSLDCYQVTLRLQGNMLRTLDGAFDGFVMLRELYLQRNRLTSFLPGALKELKHRSHLDLSNNSLTTLDDHSFDSLERLGVMKMAWNQLEALPPRVFQNLSSLRQLSLQGNRLRTLRKTVFQNLSGLRMIDLSNNGLEVVEKGSFQGLYDLVEIDLSNNRLSVLPHGIFIDVGKNVDNKNSYYTFPVILRLQGNMLSTLDGAFDGFVMLQKLYLQRNKLTSFGVGALKGLKHLSHLDLSNNSLTTLDGHSFDSLESLQTLNMAWNQLEALPPQVFRNLSRLIELHLQGNRLRRVPAGLFQSLSRLEELDLSKNSLNALPAGLFASQYRIREIDLSQNSLSNRPDELFGQLRCQAFENFTCLLQT